ncbi:ectonucleotide pyrophosphatase/phosphodiesterase family member 5-like [Antedon mediterranea]|uniref:ectonucleotide pyrophosphatase/phosphodiesterase family member 5-like n=1 Tax=Antedon mediterranea TaxID=105859 RepID=UPI003AF558F2
MFQLFCGLVFCLVCLPCCTIGSASADSSRVLLVSLDGFRADYLDKADLPNFRLLKSDGVRAKYTINAFITKTLSNHYTIVTGLYQESHGIVGNNMYDPVWDEHFNLGHPSYLDQKWWNSGEPIWITNQNNFGKSAVINWPGSFINIRNEYPTYYLPTYDESIPLRKRIDWIVKHFQDDDVNLGILYHHEPDPTGHKFGPNSPELIECLKSLDDDIGYLVDQMKRTGLYDTTNIIITSDHGMADVSIEQIIELDKLIDSSLYNADNNNPIIGIWPKDEDEDKIYNILKSASDHMHVYKKDEIPSDFHYQANRRIAPILLVAKEGWMIYQNFTAVFPTLEHRKDFNVGEHGFDNRLEVMHPMFIAHGPVFNQYQPDADPFHTVDIYPLICYILGIPESPNNGSLSRVSHILKPNMGLWWITNTVFSAISTELLLLTLNIPILFLFWKMNVFQIRNVFNKLVLK